MAEFLSTKPYKGTRDFYPPEMRSREWMFFTLVQVVESFGYERYDGPLLEPIELYLRKTSEEIVNQQIYSFVDRGERKVAIRPEMTPTVARMVSAKIKELVKPLRWYSIPNLWRYEQPGRGRLREHWQLNCDIFGAANEFLADVEILHLAISLLNAFGANENHFTVRINHRGILNQVYEEKLRLPAEKWLTVSRIIDKKEKISSEEYEKLLKNEGLLPEQIKELNFYLEEKQNFLRKNQNWVFCNYLLDLMDFLKTIGLAGYIEYDPSIVRGFDYYTGMVFEIYDKSLENRRSLFGGGRYDNLTNAFVKDKITAVGFGMGDVTLEDFLKTHGLWKEFGPKTEIYVALFSEKELLETGQILAKNLRRDGFKVEISLNTGKLAKQFEEAHRKKIPFVVVIGSEELEKNLILLKEMETGKQSHFSYQELVLYLQQKRKK